jgi:hypothetical protein
MTNPHEQLRREQKASALAVVLARLGCSAADAERLDATARRQAADPYRWGVGYCDLCRRPVALTASGVLHTHGPADQRCAGSGMVALTEHRAAS